MHIALINVVMDGDYQYEQEVPLGVCSIAAFLRLHGHEVTIHQCFATKGEAQVEAAAAVRADVYGFQLTMVNFAAVRDVAIRLRQAQPQARIIAGGPFLSMLYQEILSNGPSIDAIVIGEGEFTVLEYLAALSLSTPRCPTPLTPWTAGAICFSMFLHATRCSWLPCRRRIPARLR